MNDYIERRVLLANVKDIPTWFADEYGTYGRPMKCPDGAFDCEDIISAIENVPAADVVPIVHGRWIKTKSYGRYECSACRAADCDCDDYYGTHRVTAQEFCPYCGAKMDSEAGGV